MEKIGGEMTLEYWIYSYLSNKLLNLFKNLNFIGFSRVDTFFLIKCLLETQSLPTTQIAIFWMLLLHHSIFLSFASSSPWMHNIETSFSLISHYDTLCLIFLLEGALILLLSIVLSACNAEDTGSILGSGRSPGEENGNPLSILAWGIPWTEKPGGLQSMGSQKSWTWLSH